MEFSHRINSENDCTVEKSTSRRRMLFKRLQYLKGAIAQLRNKFRLNFAYSKTFTSHFSAIVRSLEACKDVFRWGKSAE